MEEKHIRNDRNEKVKKRKENNKDGKPVLERPNLQTREKIMLHHQTRQLPMTSHVDTTRNGSDPHVRVALPSSRKDDED